MTYIHVNLELIIPLLGLLGFIGNLIIYLQSEFRSSTCCIYLLWSSFVDIISLYTNVFPYYLQDRFQIDPIWYWSTGLCKIFYFFYNFLPQLSINLTILSIIDRYACSCPLSSKWHSINQMKMVPRMISITILISSILTIYGPILANIYPFYGCNYAEIKIYGVCNIIINGLIQPIVMLIFTLLTYRNVRLGRQRAVNISNK